MSDDAPQPDRIDGARHPRDTPRLIGQEAAEAAFLDGFKSGKLHHAWLLTGRRGVGKATLAWRIARFLLATPDPDGGGMFASEPPASLNVDHDHPVARRIAAGGEGALKAVTRSADEKTGRLRKQIVVDDIRKLNGFFQMSAADGGRRVVIVDDADLMNPNAANALLKMLEEPPARAIILLISHRPSGLLPTIRSRCRTLRLGTLDATQMAEALAQSDVDVQGDPTALAALSGGSVGGALGLSLMGGLQLYAELVSLLGTLPQLDRSRALKLAEAAATRGAEEKLALLFTLVDLLMLRLARTGALGQPPTPEAAPKEAEILSRLAAGPAQGRAWAEAAYEIGARARHGMAVNLDPAALVLDTLFKMGETARTT